MEEMRKVSNRCRDLTPKYFLLSTVDFSNLFMLLPVVKDQPLKTLIFHHKSTNKLTAFNLPVSNINKKSNKFYKDPIFLSHSQALGKLFKNTSKQKLFSRGTQTKAIPSTTDTTLQVHQEGILP